MTTITKLHFNGVDYDVGYNPSESVICAENISKGDIVSIHDYVGANIHSGTQNIGDVSNNQKVGIGVYGSGISSNVLYLWLGKVGSGQNITVRIETDNGGKPSGTLVNANATATISSGSLSTTLTKTKITLGGNISLTLGTKYRIVVSCPSTNTSNYCIVGYTNLKPKSDLIYGGSWGGPSVGIGFGITGGGMTYSASDVVTYMNVVFSQNIHLTSISYGTTCTISGGVVSYSGSTSGINQDLVAGVTYSITINRNNGGANATYGGNYGSSDPMISSISNANGNSSCMPQYGITSYFYYSTLDSGFGCMTGSKLFSDYAVKCDTTKITTLSDYIGIAKANGTEGNKISVSIDGGTVDNSSWDLTPGQDYLFVGTSMKETKSDYDNYIFLGKAITENQIKLDIKITIYQDTTGTTVCPFDGVISSAQTGWNGNNHTAASSSFVLDGTTYHMGSMPILKGQKFSGAFERAVAYKNR